MVTFLDLPETIEDLNLKIKNLSIRLGCTEDDGQPSLSKAIVLDNYITPEIVKRWNAHDDLLAELKAMHEHRHPNCSGGCPTLAIIAKATGGAS